MSNPALIELEVLTAISVSYMERQPEIPPPTKNLSGKTDQKRGQDSLVSKVSLRQLGVS